MKNLKTFLALCLCVVFSLSPALAVNSDPPASKNLANLTVGDIAEMKFKDLKLMSPIPLKLKDRINFMVTRKMIKNQIRKGNLDPATPLAATDDNFELNVGGFLLGFLLGLLGLLIVAIFFDKPKKNAIISSLLGMALWVVLVVLLV